MTSSGWPAATAAHRLRLDQSLCAVEPMSDGQARRVGVLAANAGHDDVVDVSVVEGALRRGDGVVTANRGDINLIARAAGAQLHVEDV